MIKFKKTNISLVILFLSIFCWTPNLLGVKNTKTSPVPIFYGPNESHSNDWAKIAPNGDIGIVYYNKYNNNLFYRLIKPDGSNSKEVISSGSNLEVCVLLFDPESRPHVFYSQSSNSDQFLYHYFKTDVNEWDFEVVIHDQNTGGKFFYELSADISTDDKCHLLVLKTRSNPDSDDYYLAFQNANLYHITNANGTWVKDLIHTYDMTYTNDEYAKAFNRQDIKVDSEGFSHIIFGEQVDAMSWAAPSRIQYANNRSGDWQIETAFDYDPNTRDDAAFFMSLCLDNNDIPHLSSCYIKRVTTGSAMSAKLYLSKRISNQEWNHELVCDSDDGYYARDGRDYTGGLTNLFFDGNNNPLIAYTDIASTHDPRNCFSLGNIRLAKKANDVWNISTIYRQDRPSAYYNGQEIYGLCMLNSQENSQIQFVAQEIILENSEDYFCNLLYIDSDEALTVFNIESTTAIREDIFNSIAELEVYPNPFKHRLNISLDIIKPSNLEVKIVDNSGRLIYFLSKLMFEGSNVITWDAVGFDGHIVSPGIYYLQFYFDDVLLETKSVVLV